MKREGFRRKGRNWRYIGTVTSSGTPGFSDSCPLFMSRSRDNRFFVLIPEGDTADELEEVSEVGDVEGAAARVLEESGLSSADVVAELRKVRGFGALIVEIERGQMTEQMRKKVIDFLAKNDEESKAEIEEWNDLQLRESFLEYNCASETVRSMQFAGGSSVSVSKLGGLYIASDDAGIYGPFETQQEAEDSVSFWGYDDVVYDSAHKGG